MNFTKVPSDFIKSVRSVKYPNQRMKLVVITKDPANESRLVIGDHEFHECFNDVEPFAFHAHVFWLPCELLEKEIAFRMFFNNRYSKSAYFQKLGETGLVEGTYHPDCEENLDALIEAADNRIVINRCTEFQVADGVISRTYDCTDKNGDPVRMFALFVDSKKATAIAGTPNNGYESRNCIQTVMDQAKSAIRDGERVIAATNADFFDMFGDCSPSGITVKNGRVVANPNSTRAFFGTKKDGTPVITSLAESPEILSELSSAVAGRDILLVNGMTADVASLEPFGDCRHPRTCVGLYPNNDFVLLVVDGRIPGYSHGASLTDLMRIMQSFGVEKALNLDGGGSSTMIVEQDGDLTMLNHPADLPRPLEKLIRPVYNSVLITKK